MTNKDTRNHVLRLERPVEHGKRPLHVMVGADTYRFVYCRDNGNGFAPHVLVFRRGPNGSPAGYGPMGFPECLRVLAPPYDKGRQDKPWLGHLSVPLPYVKWRYSARRLRVRSGSAYRMLDRFQRRLYP